MKITSVLICFSLWAITSARNIDTYQHVHPRVLNPDAIIFQVFEMLKWLIKNGSPDVLPVLDPMEFQHHTLQINVPNKLLTINANFTNGTVKGLGDFEMRKVNFNKTEIAVDLSIHFPLLTIAADHYEMGGNIYQAVPLAGYGIFDFQMKNFNFWSKIYLKQSEDGESIIIDKFHNSQYTIEKITSKTEFDRNIDGIFNSMIEDLLADNLTRFGKLILKKYSDEPLETINACLNKFDTWRMKLLLLLLLYPSAITAPKINGFDTLAELSLKKRNILVNILINKLVAYIRHVITQGSPIVGIPPLDPFVMEDFHFIIPTALFNLDIRLKNISVSGFGGFLLQRNVLHLSNLTFEIEVSLPRILINAEKMHINEIDNNLVSAIPIFNKDKPELEIDNFRLQANLQLKQSDDEKSILIDNIENAFFDLPSLKINSDEVIDKENFEILSNLEDELEDLINSCKDVFTKIISNAILTFGNPILNRLDTWRYIGALL